MTSDGGAPALPPADEPDDRAEDLCVVYLSDGAEFLNERGDWLRVEGVETDLQTMR